MNRKMRQLAPLLAIPVLLTSAVSAFAAPARSYLFTLVSQQASVHTLDSGKYQLDMTLPRKNAITAFSDRPYRSIQGITSKKFKHIWGQGSNSFAKNPPNAVLTTAGMPAEFITLSGLQLKNNQLSVDFNLMNAEAHLPTAWVKGSNLQVDMTIH